MGYKTYVFALQIDAPEGIDDAALAVAVHRAIEYAKDNDIEGADILNSDIGQVSVI